MKRDAKGRFVKKSADQIMAEVEAKKRKEEREKLAEKTLENPEEALAEDAEPMQFETKPESPEETEQSVGCAIAGAMGVILAAFAICALILVYMLS